MKILILAFLLFPSVGMSFGNWVKIQDERFLKKEIVIYGKYELDRQRYDKPYYISIRLKDGFIDKTYYKCKRERDMEFEKIDRAMFVTMGAKI